MPPLSAALFALVVTCVLYGKELPLAGRLRSAAELSGDVSYPLYVAHCPILVVAAYYFPRWSAWSFILLCLAGGVATYYLVDQPAQRYLRRRAG